MYCSSYLSGYLIVLQITTEISWIYSHSVEEDANSDSSREANIGINAKEINSSYNTIENFNPEMNKLVKLKDEEIHINGENTNMFDNVYSGFNHMSKRNTNAHRRMEKRKRFNKHKNLSNLNIARNHPVQRKSKAEQSKVKLSNIENYDNEGTSLYENRESPYKDKKNKYNVNHGVDVQNKNSKMTKTSKEYSPSKFIDSTQDEISLTNITDGPYKDEDNKESNGVVEPTVEDHVVKEISPNIPNESEYSENSDEHVKKGHGHKLKRKILKTQHDTQTNSEDSENKFQASKTSKTKLSFQDLSEMMSLSAKSGTNFGHSNSPKADDTSLDTLPKEAHVKDTVLQTQKSKASDNGKFEEGKNDALVRDDKQSERDRFNNIEKGEVLESENSLNENNTPYEEKFAKSVKENINTPSLQHENHKIDYKQVHNHHGQKYTSIHNSVPTGSIYDLKNKKQKKRSKKKASLKTRPSPAPEVERKYFENSNRDNHLDEPNLDIPKEINNLEDAPHFNSETANKRNERDIRKRLRKHNNYKNHMQEGNVFGYRKNSEESEESNNIQNDQGSYSDNNDYDDSEHRQRKLDVNSNNNDKYSYKESFEDEIGPKNDEEITNTNKYRGKKTFSRQSHEPKQKDASKEKCIEYKEDRVTKKPTSTTVSSVEKCTTKGTTCTAKHTTVKTKTTTQTCNKSLTTKRIEPENGKDNSTNEVLDVFQKYLCGQLANDFVDAVIEKVKRSRKIYKELGFRNDSEETCDRCIETKPNKMPDKELLKKSMGKCSKNNESKSSCHICYNVPKPMEAVMNLLVSFEKEHENSVYSKIRDDSSFIFTGDYPEQFNQNVDSVRNKNKYTGDRDSLGKEAFDKQDLREDNNEEKHDSQVANRNYLDYEYSTLEVENKHEEHSTEAVEVNKNENVDQMYNTKLAVQKNLNNKDEKSKNEEKSSLNLDDKVEENGSNDEVDRNDASKSKYSSLKGGPDTNQPEDSFDRGSIKERRKAFKSDKLLSSENNYITQNGQETELANGKKPHNLDFIDKYPSNERYDNKNPPVIPKERYYDSDVFKNVRQHHKTPNQFKSQWPHNENNKLPSFHFTSDKFSHKRNHFDYPSEDYNADSELLPSQNNGHSVGNGFMSAGWDSNEYQLMPKQRDREGSEHDMVYSVPRKKYHTDYDERLNMVKRESEPSYEDEPLLIEIPNIEYDLY